MIGNRVGSITRDAGRQLCLSTSTQLSFSVFSEAFSVLGARVRDGQE